MKQRHMHSKRLKKNSSKKRAFSSKRSTVSWTDVANTQDEILAKQKRLNWRGALSLCSQHSQLRTPPRREDLEAVPTAGVRKTVGYTTDGVSRGEGSSPTFGRSQNRLIKNANSTAGHPPRETRLPSFHGKEEWREGGGGVWSVKFSIFREEG